LIYDKDIMNNLSKIFLIIFIISLFSCLSTGNIRKLAGKEINLNQDLFITINSLSYDLPSVYINGRYSTPVRVIIKDGKRTEDRSGVLTELKILVNNSGDIDYKYSELNILDMVFIDNTGEMKIVQYSPMLNNDWKNPQKTFLKGKKINEIIYFIHDKGSIPVALTVDRVNHILLTDETNPKYNEIMSFLKKHLNIQKMLTMAQFCTFEEIDVFRKENNIDINDSNRQGLDLLYTGILSGNDSVVIGAINNGSDLHKKIFYNHLDIIEPIHAAFLVNNRNAIKALINAGVDINQLAVGDNSPAVIAVRSNNVGSLKLLTEFGVDLTKLMIPMNWSPAIPALKFAKDRKMDEMVQFLENLEN